MITDHGIIIQLNKEMVESFSMVFDNFYNFKKIEADTLNSLAGYVNVLYDGNISLYVKYKERKFSSWLSKTNMICSIRLTGFM